MRDTVGVPICAAGRRFVLFLLAILAATACSSATGGDARQAVPGVRQAAPGVRQAAPGVRQAAPGGDGDSWKDTRGVEYRLGLVNAPEYNECFGPEATRARKRLVARGFRATEYTRDKYGRHVSDITLTDGRDLNVLLAREGFVNDRYLRRFRQENPALAGRLDAAFSAARAERAGLWGACPAA